MQQPHRPAVTEADRQRLLTSINDRYLPPCEQSTPRSAPLPREPERRGLPDRLLSPRLPLADLLSCHGQITDPRRLPGMLLDPTLDLGDLPSGHTQVTDPRRL